MKREKKKKGKAVEWIPLETKPWGQLCWFIFFWLCDGRYMTLGLCNGSPMNLLIFRLGADYGNAISDIYRQEHECNCLALKQMLEGNSRQWIQLNLNQEEEEWLWWDSNNNSTNPASLHQWKGQEGSPKTQSSHSPESFQPWKNPREYPGAMQLHSRKG